MPDTYCHICDEWRPADEVCTHTTKLRRLIDRIEKLEQSETMQAARIAELERELALMTQKRDDWRDRFKESYMGR